MKCVKLFFKKERKKEEKKGGGKEERKKLPKNSPLISFMSLIIPIIPSGQMMPPLWVSAPSSKARAGYGSERGARCWWRVIALSFNYPGPSSGEKLCLLGWSTKLLAMREI